MEAAEKSLSRRLASFVLALACTWAFVFVFCPFIRDLSPEARQLAAFIDFSGIETGEFYYTDVEIVGHANMGTKSTMEFLPHGPGPLSN